MKAGNVVALCIERMELTLNGQPVVGWFSSYTPEEVFYSGGLRPYKLLARAEPIEFAHAYLPTTFSPAACSALDAAFRGKYDFLQGLVVVNSGVSMYRLYDAWKHFIPTPFIHLLDVPKNVSKENMKYYCRRIRDLMDDLSTHFGIVLTDEGLFEAILHYNETRRLLEQLYQIRRINPRLLSGGDTLRLIQAVTMASRGTVNAALTSLVNTLAMLPPSKTTNINEPPVIVTGDILDQPVFIDMIDKVGGRVVCEDLEGGIQYCRGLVSTEGDPVEALSQRYLEKYPTASMADLDRRFRFLFGLVEEFGARGVIYYTPKFSDSNLYEYPHLRKRFLDRNIPSLFLEVDNVLSNTEQIKTRLQAFLEIL